MLGLQIKLEIWIINCTCSQCKLELFVIFEQDTLHV